MGDDVKFPTTLPPPRQLELPRAQLSILLNQLTAELLEMQNDLLKAGNAFEFTAAVRAVVSKIAEANAGWQQMSETIRQCWQI